MQKVSIAFDVYGTLIDTQGVTKELSVLVGDKAHEVSQLWRNKQLEYSFRRGLMQNYVDFALCTRQALEYVDMSFQLGLSEDQKISLMQAYKTLPAFADSVAGLQSVDVQNYNLFAFSNGRADMVEGLLRHAGIRHHFTDVVSVDEQRSYKPNPAVYSYFMRQAGCATHQAWMVSSNPFDVIGAISAGMRAVWVQRSPDVIFDPWEITPTVTIQSLTDLKSAIDS